MAKDDYDVIVFKILTYLYACLKGKVNFGKDAYYKIIGKENINEQYLYQIYRMMVSEGLIENAKFTRAWGNEYILISDEADLQITANGIHYLKNNNSMKEVGKYLLEGVELISKLISLVGLGF